MFAPPLSTVGPCLWWGNQGAAGPLEIDERYCSKLSKSGVLLKPCVSEEGESVDIIIIAKTNRRESF